MTLKPWKFNMLKSPKWAVCGIAMISFAGGSLLTGRQARTERVRADSNRVSSFGSITNCRANSR